jgi:hypothetical protein
MNNVLNLIKTEYVSLDIVQGSTVMKAVILINLILKYVNIN